MAEFEKVCRDVCTFKQKVVNMFSPAYTSELVTLNFHILNHLIEDVSKFGGLSPLDAPSLKLLNRSVDAACRHMAKQTRTRTDEMVFSLDQAQTNGPWVTP